MVGVLDDLTDEPDETFLVQLSLPVHVTIGDGDGEGVVTILDDDLPPALSIDDVSVIEGDMGTSDATFGFALTLPSGFDIRVAYATTDGAGILRPATAGDDYVADSGFVAIPAGDPSGMLTVVVLGDLVDELDEFFTVTLSDPVHVTILDAEGVGTILDDDEALLGVDDQVVEEGDEGHVDAIFTVDLTNPSDREIEVTYGTRPGPAPTATEGEDYADTRGNVVFPPGEQESEVPVRVFGDLLFEDDETFEVHLSDPVNAGFRDPLGIGTILDNELCLGPNLLTNGSGESALTSGELAGWIEVAGSDWTYGLASPAAAVGDAYLVSASADLAELAQDIDVSAYANRIAAGTQQFELSGFIGQGFPENAALPPADTRIVVEFRDATNTLVLGDWDSGAPVAVGEWQQVVSDEFAPAGTRWIRVRLLSAATETGGNLGHFDGLSVRSIGVPAVWIDDVLVYEADGLPAVFPLHLSCPVDGANSVFVQTADGTALTPDDYAATAATVSFAKGETDAELPVPIVRDGVDEPAEDFFADLSDLVGPYDPVLLDAQGVGTILDARRCPRSPGYWKNHAAVWPVQWLRIGDQVYDVVGLLELLQYGGPDASNTLARQLVAAKLNLSGGADPYITPVVEAADDLLSLFPPGSDPRGSDRQAANALKDQLDDYDDLDCEDDDEGDDDDDEGGEGDDEGDDDDDEGGDDDDGGHGGDDHGGGDD